LQRYGSTATNGGPHRTTNEMNISGCKFSFTSHIKGWEEFKIFKAKFYSQMPLPLLIPLAHVLITHGGLAHAGAIHAGAGAGVAHAGGSMNINHIIAHYGKAELTGQMKAKAREFARANCRDRDDLEFILSVIDRCRTVGDVFQVLKKSGRLS
jgi:hypothetical protein